MSDDFEVVGGSHGIEADIDDMMATGGAIRSAGVDVGGTAVSAHGVLVDGNLLSSVVLSPGSFASAETALLGALDGPGGLSSNAIKMTAAGLAMQGKAQAWYAFDQAQEFGEEVRHWAEGKLALPLLLNPVGLTAAGLYLWQDGAFDDPQAWLVAHPDLLEETVGSSPFLLNTLTHGIYPNSVEQAAGLLASIYDQGGANVDEIDVETPPPPPHNLAESLNTLDGFDEPGTFQIQQTTAPDGSQVYNVYLPGTKKFDSPFDESGLIQNMGTNLAAVAGADNAYEDAVVKALAQANVPHDARIVLTGHSQGGIIAARLANRLTDAGNGEPYNVTNVVTAGSPVDAIEVPESVQMLSLANEYDLVPRLDGEKYDDRSNHTTILTQHQTGTVTGNHMLLDTYTPMAQDLDTSTDPAVRDAMAPLDDFYAGGENHTWTFSMERD